MKNNYWLTLKEALVILGAMICKSRKYPAGNNVGKFLLVSEIILESKNCQKKPVTTNQKSG
jgi:hypothetical protein